MTVRNLIVERRRSNAPYNEDTIYFTCQMLDKATGEWYKQDFQATDATAFRHLSNWNAIYDTPKVKAASAAMIADIYANQAAYGCGF